MAGRHRADLVKPGMTAWLGAGAITLGIGAALTSGAAIASASPGESDGTSSSSGATSPDNESKPTSKPTTSSAAQSSSSDTAGTPKKKKPRHSADDSDAAPAKAAAAEADRDPGDASDAEAKTGTDTPTAQRSRVTHKRSTVAKTSNTSTPAVDTTSGSPQDAPKTAPAVAATTTDTVATPKAAALPTAKAQSATAAPANPLVAINQAIQSFLHNIQVQYFNTPPKITGYTAPTLNGDGTYSGQIFAVDADGDPLIYSATRPPFSSGLTIDQNGNYTLTPSAYALTREGTGELTFAVVEANAADHYHGIDKVFEKAIRNALQPIFGQFHLYVGYVPEYYGTAKVVLPSTPWGNTDPTPPAATSTFASAKATVSTAAATDPFTSFVYGVYGWINKTFNNTAPTITIGTPTKNADGTYTGLVTTSDVDGDPLTIRDPWGAGATTFVDNGDGTYTYTYTPSEAATTTPNYKYYFYFVAVETNAAAHFHGAEQLENAIWNALLGNLLRALDPISFSRVFPPYSPSTWGSTGAYLTLPVGPVVPV